MYGTVEIFSINIQVKNRQKMSTTKKENLTSHI